MKINKFRSYILLTILGFIAAITVGLVVFVQLRNMMINYSNFSKKNHREQIERLNMATLANMTEFIESQYPVLHDTDRLKREAGTDWFWSVADEWHETATIFDLAYIYYIEKDGDNFNFLMSSGIRRDEHPEWLSGHVWLGTPPAFIEEAWETKKITTSPEPIVNEWGTLISVVLPIITSGKIVGILGIDYDISFLNTYYEQEQELENQENALIRRIQNILIVFIVMTIVFMFYQVWLSTKSALVPLQEIEADERVRIMLDATPMICALWDGEGNLIDCNKETLNLLDLADKPEYFRRFNELSPEFQPNGEKSTSAIERYYREALENGQVHYKWMACTASGKELPLETTVVRVPWKNGWRLACYARDIRDIKAKEALVEETEERLQVMVDTMAMATFFFDTEGNPIDCNQRAVAIFGSKDKKELLNGFFNYSPEYQPNKRPSRELVKENIEYALKTGKNVFLWEHLKADGTPLPAEITLIRVIWKDGYRIVSYTRDLSKLVETEDNLRRILATAEGSPHLTLFLGASGNIEYMNPAVTNISGFTREELQREGFALLFNSEDYEQLNKEYLAEALKGKLTNFEMKVHAKNGTVFDFVFSIYAIQMHDGSSGIGLLGRDITELKQMQRELAVAKEQAEKALAAEVQFNKAKSDFLSRVSHELRTPINAIMGMTDIAQKSFDKKKLKQCYEKIEDSSKHLLNLVNDILDITSFETGNFDFSPKPFNFNNTMRLITETIAQKAKSKEQDFTAAIDREIPPWLQSDERRLQQVLLNLLNNAVKFTPEKGKIELSAKMPEINENNCTIQFEVTDTGIGITQEVLDHIGGIFEQADNTITREYSGMGIGLHLTQRIIKMMNGSIKVESEPGKGSRFILCLRFGIAEAPVPEEKNNKAETETADLSGRRILIVDDVEINIEIIIAILEDSGAVFDRAINGKEAVNLVLQNSYDLILLDLHMPVMDGFTAAKKIRDSDFPGAKTIPIISVSAESGGDLYIKCMDAGINDYLTKPIDKKSLFGMITKWISNSV